MKISLGALSILMVMEFSSLASSGPNAPNSPKYCCFSYVHQPIPRENVIKYDITSSHCSQPSVLFWDIEDRIFCAKPGDTWVEHYMKELESN